MANVKISELTSKAVPASADEIVLVDSVGGASKKTTVGALPSGENNRTLDAVPTDGNTANSVSSDGVFDALATKSDTTHNHDSSYATATQGTTADNALPKAGGTMTGDLSLGDDDEIKVGDDVDLRIYHDSATAQSIISEEGGGSFILKGTDVYIKTANDETSLFADTNGTVKLYYDSTEKLATTSTGIDVTGDLTVNKTGAAAIEVGGTTAAHIDLKSPNSDDFDVRLISYGTGAELSVAGSNNLSVKTDGSERLEVNGSGINVTGDVVVSGTVDGVDIATRDGVLTSTTNTADAALPKAGGTMTDILTVQKDGIDEIIQVWQSDLGTYTRNITLSSPESDSTSEPFRFNTGNTISFETDGGGRLLVENAGINVTGDTTTDSLTVQGAITETEAGTANATYTIDLSLGTLFEVTNASLCTVTMPTAAAGKSFTVIATVPAAWSGTILWSGGAAPTGGSGKTIYSFVSNGTSWYGMRAGTGFA